MRLSFLYLWLSMCLKVLTLNTASPYELLYLYSVYKTEWLSLPSDERTIATGCTHSADSLANDLGTAGKDAASAAEKAFQAEVTELGIVGICSIDDFIKYIGTERTFIRYKYTVSGTTTSPAWKDILNKLKKPGAQLTYDFQKLLPGADFGGESPVPFSKVLSKVIDAMQVAREAATFGDSVVATTVANAISYLKVAHQRRIQDNVGYVYNYITNSEAGAPFTFLKKKVTNYYPDGSNAGSYNTGIDYDGTIQASDTATDAQKAALLSAIQEYPTTSDTARIHNDVIEAMKQSGDLLATEIDSCLRLPF